MENLEILYEDNHVLVVKKPQNVPTQEDESKDPDLLNMVKGYIKESKHKEGEAYVGLVHRLDRPTGGVMVFAKTSKAASRLSEQIKSGEMEKTYYAITRGVPKIRHSVLVNYLKKDTENNKVSVVPQTTEGAKRAELEYWVIDESDGYALVQIKLKTGRGHQIRTQLSYIKCPIYGDQKYGGVDMPKANLNLFAVDLKFTHPTTKERMTFRCFPPEDENMWNKFNLEKYLDLKVDHLD